MEEGIIDPSTQPGAEDVGELSGMGSPGTPRGSKAEEGPGSSEALRWPCLHQVGPMAFHAAGLLTVENGPMDV